MQSQSLCGYRDCPRRGGRRCPRCERMADLLAAARMRRLQRLSKGGNRFAGLAARRYEKRKEKKEWRLL